MSDSSRHRCLTTGCNPYLANRSEAETHKEATGHRIAPWPVRSAEGKRRARERNRNGYYDKYNVGEKSAAARGLAKRPTYHDDGPSYLRLLDERAAMLDNFSDEEGF